MSRSFVVMTPRSSQGGNNGDKGLSSAHGANVPKPPAMVDGQQRRNGRQERVYLQMECLFSWDRGGSWLRMASSGEWAGDG